MAGKDTKETTGRWTGVLVDAGCRDRQAARRAAAALLGGPAHTDIVKTRETIPSETPTQRTSENEDAYRHHNEQHRARQPASQPCAVTAGTRGFALLLADGKWLEFPEGADILVNTALRSTRQGRNLLEGKSAAGRYFKAVIAGRLRAGNRLHPDTVRIVP